MNILTRKEMYGGYYHTIIVISPTAGTLDDVYSSLKIPEENFLKEFDKTIFDQIIEARKDMIMKKGIDTVARNDRCLIILDDVIAERTFLQSSQALKMFTLLRHYLCSVIILVQSYTKCPRAIRLGAMCTFIFPSTRSEVEIVKDEICPPSLTKQDFQRVIEYCTQGRYDFLTYNRHAEPDQRVRKNLTEIVDLEKFKTKESSYYRSDYRKNKNLDEDKEKDEKY
jgi:hypothetical protein